MCQIRTHSVQPCSTFRYGLCPNLDNGRRYLAQTVRKTNSSLGRLLVFLRHVTKHFCKWNENFIWVKKNSEPNWLHFNLPQANLQESYTPAHHEYVFGQFVVSPKRRKISAQPCTHKNCGMIFPVLPIAEASVSARVCTTPNPELNIQNWKIFNWIWNFFQFYFILIHAEILVPYSHTVTNRFEFAATKLCALYNWTKTLYWHGRDNRW